MTRAVLSIVCALVFAVVWLITDGLGRLDLPGDRFDRPNRHVPGQASEASAPAEPAEGSATPGNGRSHHEADAVDRRRLLRLLERVEVIDARPEVPGYDRECGTGHATNDCVVEHGILADPYTGTRIEFHKATAYEVGIDHLYPLAYAWDMGASSWPEDRRRNFANDPFNLLAVSGPANSSKNDNGPGEWLPINTDYRCTYLTRFLKVAIVYDLPITTADQEAVATLAPNCNPRKDH